jgi:PAS domain S-box-containing protein
MNYTISELIDIDELHTLCEYFTELSGFATAILDMEGNVLTAAGWQDICTHYHRRNPETVARCRESEQYLVSRLRQGEKYTFKRCKNGLYDVAVPLIIDDRQIGSLYAGQFLLEAPDPEAFRRQAARFGFDETSYLEALTRVPVVTEERVKLVMEFLLRLATMIGGMGLANRNARRASLVVENSPVVLFRWWPIKGRPVKYVSENIIQFGYTPEDFLTGAVLFESLLHPEDRGRVLAGVQAFSDNGVTSFQQEYRIFTKDGRMRWVDNRTSVERDHGGNILFYQGIMLDITERKEAELALQFTQFAVDHTRDSAYWTGPDGSFLYVNEASCRALGYTREEFRAMSISDIRPALPAELWPAHWQEVRERKSFSFETRHRRRDGSTFPVEVTVNYVLFDGREYNCAFARDITERKQMEKQLLLIQIAFDHNFDACFWVRPRGEITYVNEAACRSLGYTREELLTMTVADIDPDWCWDGDTLAEKYAALKQAGTMVIQSRHRRKNGEIFPVEICNNFVEFEGEEFNCTFVRDIRERKRMEDALRLSNLVVENSQVVLFRWWASPGWPVDMVSRNVSQFGYTAEEFLSGSILYASIIYSQDLERITQEVSAYSTQRATHFQMEYRIVTRDGRIRWVDERSVVERDSEGQIVFFQGALIDITERKKMEEELVKAQKLESVGLLAGGIAHDFNNILTGILGNVSLAKTLFSPQDRAYGYVSNIESAAYRAKDLTRQFLTFSKGGAPIRKPVNSVELIRNNTQLALSGLKSTCELIIPNDLRIVEVDEGQISQVINNLIINADQAMAQGGVIRVVCENVEVGAGNGFSLKEGSYVRVGVSDQGVGIAAGHMGKIFDPYFTTKDKGRGLGLASAYAIMKKHAGHICVHSKSGAGATFTLYLPASAASTAVTAEEPATAAAGNGRILVMDDEPVVRMVAGEMLEHMGYDVDFAQNGEEALVMYGAARESGVPFDAVIMDLTVPGGMGGREAIRRMREIDPNVRAIVSSGYSDDPVMADYASYGFVGVMVKPYDLGELGAQLERVLRKQE